MAQVAEIRGTVDGDIDFLGQVWEIKDNGIVKGNINSHGAQVIKVRGLVEGEITGSYQTLDDPSQDKRSKTDASEPDSVDEP
jgi:cytoskeletal protein CcmA (bactofilin family)